MKLSIHIRIGKNTLDVDGAHQHMRFGFASHISCGCHVKETFSVLDIADTRVVSLDLQILVLIDWLQILRV